MTGEADSRVSPLRPPRVEVGAVRVDPEGPELRMALHAVPLRMAGRAAFQRLPRRLTVPEEPHGLSVVEALAQSTACLEAGLGVAVAAEGAGIMALRTVERPSVRRRGVAGSETRRVELAAARGAGSCLSGSGGCHLVRYVHAATRPGYAHRVHHTRAGWGDGIRADEPPGFRPEEDSGHVGNGPCRLTGREHGEEDGSTSGGHGLG
jgi:hypothetical protein